MTCASLPADMEHGCLSFPALSPASLLWAFTQSLFCGDLSGLQEAHYARTSGKPRRKGEEREGEQNDRIKLTDPKYMR